VGEIDPIQSQSTATGMMTPNRDYRIFRVYNNSRVESVGKHVRWVRLPNADLVASRWRRRTNVFLHLHGKLAAEPLWIRVRTSDQKLYDVDSRDLDELLRRDPRAK
jgi:hypothetical protein